MAKIVYTDQKTFEEPVIEVKEELSESQITKIVGHDDWDYVADDVSVTAIVKLEKPVIAVVSVIALLSLLILPVSAEWQSRWKTLHSEEPDAESGECCEGYSQSKN